MLIDHRFSEQLTTRTAALRVVDLISRHSDNKTVNRPGMWTLGRQRQLKRREEEQALLQRQVRKCCSHASDAPSIVSLE